MASAWRTMEDTVTVVVMLGFQLQAWATWA
jgi:hypothetical protein